MFPFIKNYPTYTLNVPSITGGLNLRDGLSRVNDNQMTDAKNQNAEIGAGCCQLQGCGIGNGDGR